MRCLIVILAVCVYVPLRAQSVRYSPFFRDYRFNFQPAAKAGSFYWIEKETFSPRSQRQSSRIEMRQTFEVYDDKLDPVAVVGGDAMPEGTIKQYLIGGASAFTEIFLVRRRNWTDVMMRRYECDGATALPLVRLDSLPFADDASSFLLLRSGNKKKIQLIGFETGSGIPRMHVIQFDDKFTCLKRSVYSDVNISQPCIQDDFVSYPVEEYDNLPVKLADDGEWVMSAGSRTSSGYLLIHFCVEGNFTIRHLRLPLGWQTQDLSLTFDKVDTGLTIGIMSSYHSTTLRQLQVSHYSRTTGGVDFDSSYYFNTLAGTTQNKNLVSEDLIGFPGRGYVLFKEYGRSKTDEQTVDHQNDAVADNTLTSVIGSPVRAASLSNGFARKSGLFAMAPEYDRGDLSIFYFPARSRDSTWSGMLRSPQTTEMNWPALSYLVLPADGKMIFVYNSPVGNSQYATTTALDHNGWPSDAPLTFWRFNRVLDFQHSHRIASDEVAVPYSERPGFAVVKIPR